MPENVLNAGLSGYNESFSARCLTEDQVDESESSLRSLKDHPVATRSEHLRFLQDRHDSWIECPRCGAPLKQRTAKRGPRAGRLFLGCSRYPACKYIRNIA